MAAPQHSTPTCASCGRPLGGRFCSECGEERLDFHKLTVRHFLTHCLHEIFELDGKIWRTLRALLFRPGFLALEYSAGRRRLYVNPFRLLITAALVYEVATSGGVRVAMNLGPVVVSLAPAAVKEGTSIAETVQLIDRFHLLGGLLAERSNRAEFESESSRGQFHRRLEKFAEPLSFANVFMLALTMAVLFGRRRRHFVEHGIFSMHFISFVLLTGLLFAPISHLLVLVPAAQRGQPLTSGWGIAVLSGIAGILVWQFSYLVMAIRRYYLGPKPGRLLRLGAGFGAVAAYFLNSVFITGVQTAGAAIALWLAR